MASPSGPISSKLADLMASASSPRGSSPRGGRLKKRASVAGMVQEQAAGVDLYPRAVARLLEQPEMRDIFEFYVSFGDMQNIETMSNLKWRRFVKDCGLIAGAGAGAGAVAGASNPSPSSDAAEGKEGAGEGGEGGEGGADAEDVKPYQEGDELVSEPGQPLSAASVDLIFVKSLPGKRVKANSHAQNTVEERNKSAGRGMGWKDLRKTGKPGGGGNNSRGADEGDTRLRIEGFARALCVLARHFYRPAEASTAFMSRVKGSTSTSLMSRNGGDSPASGGSGGGGGSGSASFYGFGTGGPAAQQAQVEALVEQLWTQHVLPKASRVDKGEDYDAAELLSDEVVLALVGEKDFLEKVFAHYADAGTHARQEIMVRERRRDEKRTRREEKRREETRREEKRREGIRTSRNVCAL